MARCRTRQLKYLVAIVLCVFLFFVFVQLLSGGLPEDEQRPPVNAHLLPLTKLAKDQHPPPTVVRQEVARDADRPVLGKHQAPAQSTYLQSSLDLELLRTLKTYQLRLDKGITELWWYVRANSKVTGGDPVASKRITASVFDQHVMLQNHNSQVEALVERLLGGWKEATARELGGLMERRIRHLQNPPDCGSARKLVCDLTKTCGFGCQVHHLAMCLGVAYGTRRTLVLRTEGWRYASGGWETVFMPVSDTCRDASEGVAWDADHDQHQVVILPIVESLHPRPPYLPMAVPRDLAEKLIAFHGYPFVWFMGHLIQYLMRPNPQLQTYLETKRKEMGFQKPIVGVHVRRSDKVGVEAAYHGIEEYMVHVEEWFAKHGGQKRVFLATDEPDLLAEAKKKYPEYQFLTDVGISSKAQNQNTRYDLESLYGVTFDVSTLSMSDYLVCCFSSQICRLAYELMQPLHTDASRFLPQSG
eukprot:Em0001g914a